MRGMSSDAIAAEATPSAEAAPSGPEYLRLVGFAALIGIPAALVAALFLALTHDLEHWLWDDLPSDLGHSSPPWYLVVGLPAVGAAVVVVAPQVSSRRRRPSADRRDQRQPNAVLPWTGGCAGGDRNARVRRRARARGAADRARVGRGARLRAAAPGQGAHAGGRSRAPARSRRSRRSSEGRSSVG